MGSSFGGLMGPNMGVLAPDALLAENDGGPLPLALAGGGGPVIVNFGGPCIGDCEDDRGGLCGLDIVPAWDRGCGGKRLKGGIPGNERVLEVPFTVVLAPAGGATLLKLLGGTNCPETGGLTFPGCGGPLLTQGGGPCGLKPAAGGPCDCDARGCPLGGTNPFILPPTAGGGTDGPLLKFCCEGTGPRGKPCMFMKLLGENC